jgi:hypothetical protein
MSKATKEIDGPNYRHRKPQDPQPMRATLDADDWRTIVRHWEMYRSVVDRFSQDERWRDEMPKLAGAARRLAGDTTGPVAIDGPFLGFAYCTLWAASVATMGAARDLADVMTRLVPQVAIGEPKRGAEARGDD